MSTKAVTSRRQLLSLLGGAGLVGGSTALGSVIHAETGAGAYLQPAQDSGKSHSFPTGRQFELDLDNQRLVVTEVGATLRSYQVAGREFLWGFKETELPSNANGQLLLPWPERCEGAPHVSGRRPSARDHRRR